MKMSLWKTVTHQPSSPLNRGRGLIQGRNLAWQKELKGNASCCVYDGTAANFSQLLIGPHLRVPKILKGNCIAVIFQL